MKRFASSRPPPTMGKQILDYLNHLFIDGFLSPMSYVKQLLATVFLFIIIFLYFITAFIVNFLQLINFLLLESVLPNLRRVINNHLQDIVLSSLIYLFEWQCDIRFTVAFDSPSTARTFGRDQAALLVVNHSFQLDVLFFWFCSQMFGHLGSVKGFTKKSLRWMPISGWLFFFNDSIFLERDNWEHDQHVIQTGMDKLRTYTNPFLLIIAPEGTRFTEEKYQNAVKYTREHGNIPSMFKHHLLPRIKGFAATVEKIRQTTNKRYEIYNMELISSRVDNDSVFEPTLSNFIRGRSFCVDCYIEKIKPEDLPPANQQNVTETDYSESLYRIFARKDEIKEYYRIHGKVPQSVKVQRRQSFGRTFKFFFYDVLLSGSLIWTTLRYAHQSDSIILKISVWTIIVAVYGAIYVAFRMMKVSNYGTEDLNDGSGSSSDDKDAVVDLKQEKSDEKKE